MLGSVVTLILQALSFTQAIYQDEVNTLSFGLTLIGSPQEIAIHRPSNHTGSLCYVLTNIHVLAALRCGDGQVIWRQFLESSEAFDSWTLLDEYVVTTTISGRLDAWDARKGHNLWTKFYKHDFKISATRSASEDLPVVLIDGLDTFEVLQLSTGDTIASTADPEQSNCIWHEGHLYSAYLKDKQLLVGPAESTSSDIQTLHVDTPHMSRINQVYHSVGAPLVLLGTQSGTVAVYLVGSKRLVVLDLPEPSSPLSISYETLNDNAVLLIKQTDPNSRNTLYLLDRVQGTSSSLDLPSTCAGYAELQKIDGLITLQCAYTSANSTELRLYTVPRMRLLAESTISNSDQQQLIKVAFEAVPFKKTYLIRALTVDSSNGLSMLRKSHEDWSTQEGMSGVVSMIMVDVNDYVHQGSKAADEEANTLERYWNRVRAHAYGVLSLFRVPTKQFKVEKDRFGVHKIVIVFDAHCKAWAIDTVTQKVIWSRQYSSDGEFKQAETASQSIQAASILVRYFSNSTDHEVVIDALTGKISPFKSVSSSPNKLPLRISGSFVERLAEDSQSSLWTFRCPKGDRFVARAARRKEAIASVGRILGDRGVLYKYLAPDTISLISVNDQASSMTLWLLNSTNGHILYSSYHTDIGTHRPIHLVMSENWITYHYYNSLDMRFEITILELYRGSRNSKTNDLHVLAQSFIYDHEVTAMSVTNTLQGITSRDVLVALKSGHITTIPRRLLDPRRPDPDNITSYDKEEGLIPYDPIIQLDPRSILSHSLEMIGITEFVVETTLLESTSMVCAYGHDIFCSRVTPSMPFDILSNSFSKSQIIISIVALVLGIMFTRPIARRKELEKRWIG